MIANTTTISTRTDQRDEKNDEKFVFTSGALAWIISITPAPIKINTNAETMICLPKNDFIFSIEYIINFVILDPLRSISNVGVGVKIGIVNIFNSSILHI